MSTNFGVVITMCFGIVCAALVILLESIIGRIDTLERDVRRISSGLPPITARIETLERDSD